MKTIQLVCLAVFAAVGFTSAQNKEFGKYAMFEKTAKRPESADPVTTKLPLKLEKGTRIGLVGNTLFDRMHEFGHLETLIQQAHPGQELVVRNFSWAADEVDLQPRPANFANADQHLTAMQADVVLAAFGYNESFAGKEGLPAFRERLTKYLESVKAKAYNGKAAARVALVSPIANENVKGVDAADRNNANIQAYLKVMKEVAAEQKVGFVDAFTATKKAMASPGTDLTMNGAHLNEKGYQLFASTVFKQLFGKDSPKLDEKLRAEVVEKNRQHFFRYRPLNTFYYTGGRNRSYGYLDFLPAMRNFDLMTANRDNRIHALAQGQKVPAKIDDSNVPEMPKTPQSRGANKWLTPKQEREAFKVDPRFEVTLFASEEQFPDIACPIQMRWDSQGRMWVSCSTTYPHVYPGRAPNDKIVILEDLDGDGKADKSTVWADDLNVPLSFEFGDGGVYVSEEPHMTFLKDTNGDGKADHRETVLTGFGCEDSHHALHDFAWTPDGDLIFRESIFHHTQVETPYGPVRQQNSGWFAWEPKLHRLTSFGTHASTNPWGVTFDDWGQHVASYPIFASAHHALDPPYPEQHPRPSGLQAYSGVCGQEFIDFPNWPEELQGSMVKVRYKSTNRVELLQWNEGEFGYDEKYVSDIIFSTNLSFIPVDLRYGPRGGMYVCDWYNPVKGHAQYSLRDERRDRKSGRIWRIFPKGAKPQDPPKIAGASIAELLEILKRREYRYRYWAKRELRERKPAEVKAALDKWVAKLDPKDERFRHHQVEAIWAYRNVEQANLPLLREVLACDNHNARAAAARQLRHWHGLAKDGDDLLAKAGQDENGLVRMEAAIACSYVGTKEAFEVLADVTQLPSDRHLAYAIKTSLGSAPMRKFWDKDTVEKTNPQVHGFLFKQKAADAKAEKTQRDKKFDRQKNLLKVKLTCVKERMLFSAMYVLKPNLSEYKEAFGEIPAKPNQPIRIEFDNPDATPHNFVLVQPGCLEEVGLAANEMAKDPEAAKSGQFIPKSKKIIVHTKMLKQGEKETLRFKAPRKPGRYPYLCSFPGHWTIMKGVLVVK
ncbi:MAG: hypothetical protein CMI30_06900 [Opitutae bacterium]|nr:hypothetical protein [Opitutae bacterium]|tara:strand:- start:6931 stop:10098 length:3168 start_codon:yes stop_codon:yes gene_type:complete